jgi:hypothetical protein
MKMGVIKRCVATEGLSLHLERHINYRGERYGENNYSRTGTFYRRILCDYDNARQRKPVDVFNHNWLHRGSIVYGLSCINIIKEEKMEKAPGGKLTEIICPDCGRGIDPEVGECRWSDCPSNQTVCPECGYTYSAYEDICPRCYGRG